MSKNFYYVVTYNVKHPTIMGLLDRIKLKQLDEGMVDFKIRSKLYMDFEETVEVVHADFKRKFELLYPENEKKSHNKIKLISVINPMKLVSQNPEALADIIEKYGQTTGWDEDCEITFFFTEIDGEEEDIPSTWLFKYEVYRIDDEINIPRNFKNGEGIFRNVATTGVTSTYH